MSPNGSCSLPPLGHALGCLLGAVGAITHESGDTCWKPTLGRPSAPPSLPQAAAGAAATIPVMMATETHTVHPAPGPPGGQWGWGAFPGLPAVCSIIPSSWVLGVGALCAGVHLLSPLCSGPRLLLNLLSRTPGAALTHLYPGRKKQSDGRQDSSN